MYSVPYTGKQIKSILEKEKQRHLGVSHFLLVLNLIHTTLNILVLAFPVYSGNAALSGLLEFCIIMKN